MQVTLLKTKLHRAVVTHAELDYEGSCAIASDLLNAAGLYEYEQIQIYNISNGERFTTYTIRAEAGSGIISINGAAAHKAKPGDKIIIAAYTVLNTHEVAAFKPTMIYLDEKNRIIRTANAIPVQAA